MNESLLWALITVNVVALVYLLFAVAALRKQDAELRKRIDQEGEFRRDNRDDCIRRYSDLAGEMESGFESLGLVRRPARPAHGPYWIKLNDQQKEIA